MAQLALPSLMGGSARRRPTTDLFLRAPQRSPAHTAKHHCSSRADALAHWRDVKAYRRRKTTSATERGTPGRVTLSWRCLFQRALVTGTAADHRRPLTLALLVARQQDVAVAVCQPGVIDISQHKRVLGAPAHKDAHAVAR